MSLTLKLVYLESSLDLCEEVFREILENEAINSRDSVRVSKGLKTGMVSAVSGLCQGIVGSHLKQEGMV